MKFAAYKVWPAVHARVSGVVRTARRSALIDALRTVRRLVRNFMLKSACRADHRRWGTWSGHEHWWDERTRLIGSMIPRGSRVIEFGCGRRQLETCMPEGCEYVPSDLIERGPDTIVFDLNARPLPDLRHLALQVAVFGGVLEYVVDIAALTMWLGGIGIQACIASYDAWPAGLGVVGAIGERMRRLKNGYMSSLTEDRLLECFEAAHMQCVDVRCWTGESVYLFVRDAELAAPDGRTADDDRQA